MTRFYAPYVKQKPKGYIMVRLVVRSEKNLALAVETALLAVAVNKLRIKNAELRVGKFVMCKC